MNLVVLCTYSEMHSHVHCIVALRHWAKAECPFSSKPDVPESHHRKTKGLGSGSGHVTGWVNLSLGTWGCEDYFESSERLWTKRYIINTLRMNRGEEGLHFWEKFKKWLFPNLFTKWGEAPENELVSWLFEASNASKTLSMEIWVSILEPIHARGQFYAKSPKIRLQMTSVFQGVTDSLKTWGGFYLQLNVHCAHQCLELTKIDHVREKN